MVEDDGLAALVEAARGGDAPAWEALYRRAYPRLFAYARRRVASDEAARDVVSDTMARAVRGITRFRDEGNGFDAWITGIARHVVLDVHRRQARSAPTISVVPDRADTRPQPDELALHSAEAAAVREAFERLPDSDREVLELRVVMGLTSEEAAAVLGKRPSAVRMAQQRALIRLRALMDDEAAVDHA